jgi:hypothetical protein
LTFLKCQKFAGLNLLSAIVLRQNCRAAGWRWDTIKLKIKIFALQKATAEESAKRDERHGKKVELTERKLALEECKIQLLENLHIRQM